MKKKNRNPHSKVHDYSKYASKWNGVEIPSDDERYYGVHRDGKGARDYIYPELVFWNDDPGEAWNLITENILGYLHVIIDNSQNTEQLKEKFYQK